MSIRLETARTLRVIRLKLRDMHYPRSKAARQALVLLTLIWSGIFCIWGVIYMVFQYNSF